MTVYHNPRCRKSREAIQYLEEKGQDFDIIEYLKTPLTEKELTALLKKLKMRPEELLRKNESVFKEQYKGKSLMDTEWIKAMITYPKLMERPIVVRNKKAVVARPVEQIDALF